MAIRNDSQPFARRYADGRTKTEQAAKKRSVPTQSAQRMRPSCTHITMDRLRGNYPCDQCGRPSPQGWLYICTQDMYCNDTLPTHLLSQSLQCENTTEHSHDHPVALGLNPSIIAQIHAGLYTPDQIAIMIDQKRQVQNTIGKTLYLSPDVIVEEEKQKWEGARNRKTSHHTDDRTTACKSCNDSPTSLKDTAAALAFNQATIDPPCYFKCCHRCRPFLRERLPMSIESVLNGEVKAITLQETHHLPIMRAAFAQGFPTGVVSFPLRSFQSNDSMNLLLHTPNDDTASSSDLDSPTDSRCSDEVSDDELEQRLHRLVTGSDSDSAMKPSTWPDSAWVGNRNTFALPKLRRISGSINSSCPRTASSASSLSLPSSFSPPTPSTPRHQQDIDPEDFDIPLANITLRKRANTANRRSGRLNVGLGIMGHSNNSTDSFGSEIEVDGGVALTEEAVGMQMPDIMTQV